MFVKSWSYFPCLTVSVRPPQELSSLTSQLMRCWGVQRQTWHPAAMHITSFQGPFLPYLNKVHWKSWNIKTHEQAVQDVFKTDELIYLTPDSDNVLDVIESDKVYVIGGIVDRTTTKVSCIPCMWRCRGVLPLTLPCCGICI